MRRIHYGWYICAAGTLLIFMTMGVTQNGFSVFMPYIMKEYGFTNTQTSSLITIRCFVVFFSMLFVGIYYKKLSLRRGTFIAALLAAIAFGIYAAAGSYPMFCLGAAVSGLSYGLGTMIPVSILINRWFVKHRALALSICSCGSGIATIVLPPVVTILIESYSMKVAFLAECVGVLGLATLVFLILRNDPAEKALEPYGVKPDFDGELKDTDINNKNADKLNVITEGQGLTNKMWVLLGFISLLLGGVGNSGFSHLAVLYTSEGFSAGVAAAVISGTGIMLTIGKVVFGEVTDRIGGYKASLMFCTILIIGHVFCCLIFTHSMIICIFNVIMLGIGYPIATIGPSVWAGDLASKEEFSTAVGRFQVLYAAGSLVFSGVPGILADHFGGYIPAYIMFTAFSCAIMLFTAIAYKGYNDEIK